MKRLAIAVAVIAVIAAVALVVLRKVPNVVLAAPQECVATVDRHTSAPLDPEQSQNAALIVAIAVHRGMPAHAATVALATAMQESKLYNLSGGDRDSAGLFQQRPSQGWGSPAQVADPVYATNAFYDALERLPNWRAVTVTEAAQNVQHSAYPDAYAQHEPDARVLASSLTGYSGHAFSCRLDRPSGPGHPERALTELTSLFGVRGVVRGSELTIPVPTRQIGWAVAQYLLPQTPRFGLLQVSYAGYRWSAGANQRWVRGGKATAGQVVVETRGP